MAGASNEEVVRRYSEACVQGDLDVQVRLRHADWVAEWPQSGERVLGSAAFRAIHEHYPGGAPRSELVRVVGAEDRWTVTPSNTIIRVAGSGDFWWSEWSMRYPDGREWLSVSLLELRDGLVYRETVYWAEPFEAPSWRAEWVERQR
jgi:hypothetical protein